MSEGGERHTNRLVHSTSPYLLQHAHNPVDWHPWGEEALARARAEDKPILLSIGYSACHWCHVMERESFEDETIAGFMNAHFVPVKVDREERPDLDDIYMAATLAMNQGQGGWPMTVFLTPDQEPFFAGTYFPPTDRYGRPGFKTLLERIADLWLRDREGLRAQGAEVARFLRESTRPAPGPSVGAEEIRKAVAQLARDFDERWGGFGHAPKFPPSPALSLLLRAHRRFEDEGALRMATRTLGMMARGGMHDQIGGGFHRYSVDERWLVPHFEKMLYDNAQLARVYLEAFQATGDPALRAVAIDVLDYILREMTSPEGGFYSATDADSEGEEGRFFVWTPARVREALGDEEAARRFGAYYDITERGNFEGQSIPNAPRSLPEVAEDLGLPAAELEESLAAARATLHQARARRVPPGLDDKVLTAWNGLMLGALAEGFRVTGDRRYLDAATRAAGFLRAQLTTPEGRLVRTWRAGTAHLAGYLEDYAYLASGLLDLYEAGGDVAHLREAQRLAGRIREDFAAEEGGFYSTARDHESLLVRHREGHDGATPAPNAVAAHVLARLSHHLDREDLRDEAAGAIRVWAKAIARQPRAFATSLAVVDLLLDGPVELALVGAEGDRGREALRAELARHYLPNRIVAVHDPAHGPSPLPLLAGKDTVKGQAALYVCRHFACQRPVTAAADVAVALAIGAALPADGGDRALDARPLPGAATAEATAAFARAQPASVTGYAPLGDTGLVTSRIGFGSYRVDDETPEHRRALVKALRAGVDVIDTSTTYTDGGSERLVGQVLREMTHAGERGREETIVVSKLGYVQGENLERAQEKEAVGRPWPEVVKYGEGVWHCIHPEFLADQLTRSLQRLQIGTLDVGLLHNPEYFLMDAHERSHGPLERRRGEFYRRLAESFGFLEEQVRAGRVLWYGVSSNTCTRPASDPEAASLTRMLEAARAGAGEGHHFRVLQLPLNLYESGAVLERKEGPGLDRTVLDVAREAGVGVLVNRPLNAMRDAGLLRLASVEVPAPEVDLDAQLGVVAGLEDEYRRDVASRLEVAEGSVPPSEFFRWGTELPGVAGQVQGLEHWEALEGQRILPPLGQALSALDHHLSGDLGETWHAWRARYVPQLQKALGELRRRAAEKSRGVSAGLEAAIDPLLPPERRGETLSRKALWVVASTPGVSSVLVGMRREDYVADAVAVMSWPPLADPAAVYRAVRARAATLVTA
ncbi:MAG: hypothetical protein DMF78_19925 [Acidobacteria bacterium]|nr:MAG: hypothetical protein DMF78_19925 [Acidobacteriota bacterium]